MGQENAVVLGCLPRPWQSPQGGPHDRKRWKIYSSCGVGKQIEKNKVLNRVDAFWEGANRFWKTSPLPQQKILYETVVRCNAYMHACAMDVVLCFMGLWLSTWEVLCYLYLAAWRLQVHFCFVLYFTLCVSPLHLLVQYTCIFYTAFNLAMSKNH